MAAKSDFRALLSIRSALASAMLLVASQVITAQIQPEYDAVRDFSIASNPNGVWSYGYLTQLGTPLILYTFSESKCVGGLSCWAQPGVPYPYLPAVGHNDTNQTFCFLTNCFAPKFLWSQPGYNGNLSVVRWTAPTPGKWLVSGAVMGEDCIYPTSTTFYMVLNTSQVLLTAPVKSCHLPLTFGDRLKLKAGDSVDFVVDWGPNHNTYGDGTGIQFGVSPVVE